MAGRPPVMSEAETIYRGFSGIEYRVLRTVAQGASATIFDARTEDAPRGDVIVKWCRSRDRERDALEEARVLSRISHSGVVALRDVGWKTDRCFLVLEKVAGFDLSLIVRTAGRLGLPIGPRVALELIGRVAATVQAVHQAPDARGRTLGLVHGQIEPSHVMVSADGAITLLDFARADWRLRRAPSPSIPPRRPAFMAPERALDWQPHVADDVFSLGCLLSFLVGGTTPAASALSAFLQRPSLSCVAPLPDDVEEIVAQTSRLDRVRRPSAFAVACACERAAQHRGAAEESAAAFLSRLDVALRRDATARDSSDEDYLATAPRSLGSNVSRAWNHSSSGTAGSSTRGVPS